MAALIATSAVSKSRISPTRMMFGSWRRKERSAAAKLRPICSLHLHLVDAGEIELDRILDGDDVDLGRVDARQRAVERVGLARAGRPGDQHHAVRLEDRLLEPAQRLGLEAELRHVEHQVVLVEEAHDDLLAEERGQHRDAEVEVLDPVGDPGLHLDAAVLGQPLLGDVEPGHDLEAAGDRLLELERRVHHLVEDAVDAVPDAVLLLVRLDVDVGGAALDGVGEDDVDQADDRRFLGLLLQLLEVDLLILVEHLRGRRRRRRLPARSSITFLSSTAWVGRSSGRSRCAAPPRTPPPARPCSRS